MIGIKTQNVLYNLRNLTVLPRAIFRTKPKTYGEAFSQKSSRHLVFNFVRKGPPTQMFDCVPKTPLMPVKKKETNPIGFYIILYNFISCPVFRDIKKTLYYKVAIE